MRITKYYFSLFLILSSCIVSFSELRGQIQLVPNTQPFKQEIQNQRVSRATATLPFFEDFSTTAPFPDTQKWTNGGIYITNQMAIAPPSLNSVIFDGVDVNGNPYDFVNTQAIGPSDSLTSCNIDLSSYTASNTIYLSFFWQAGGLGEFPDPEDSLRVQFKDADGNWETVWVQSGGVNSSTFNQALLPIMDSKYLHNEFQFSFQSFTKLSGIYDTWIVDYIYINTNRNVNDTLYKDAVALETTSSLLSNYTSVPITHFLESPSSFLRDEINITIKNLDNIFKNITYTVTLKDTITNTNLGVLQEVNTAFGINGIDPNIPNNNITTFTIPVNASFIPNSSTKQALQYELSFSTNEGVTVEPIGLNLEINNAISNVTTLDNYYAYDDGTAEFAAGINQRLGRVAVQYITRTPDILTDIQMNIPQLEADLSGETIVLLVLKNLNSADSSLLFAESYSFDYADNRDEFLNFQLTRPVSVQDTFYIAWQQTSEEQFNVGFDRNNDNADHIFFSSDGGINWDNTDVAGSLLFRPVFGQASTAPVLALDDELESTIKIYPNPNDGVFDMEGQAIKRIELLNLQGQTLEKINLNIPQNQIKCQFPNITPGTYILLIHQQSGEVIEERIIMK